MNPETKIIKDMIDKDAWTWNKRAETMFWHSPQNARKNLIDLLRSAAAQLIREANSDQVCKLIQLSLDRVNYKELADYILEDIDSTPIEDWPEYTWGVVVKGSNNDYIAIGDRISIYNDEVIIDKLAYRVIMRDCKGARIREFNNES